MSDQQQPAALSVLVDVVNALVGNPMVIAITQTDGPNGDIAFNVTGAPNHIQRLIGENSETANALRTLLNAAGEKDGKCYTLNIQSPNSR